MKTILYLVQYILIKLFFLICKIIGYKKASNLGKIIGEKIGPNFKSKKTIEKNISYILPGSNKEKINLLIKKMWGNYGRILSEYVFLKDFRNGDLERYIDISGIEYLEEIKKKKFQLFLFLVILITLN